MVRILLSFFILVNAVLAFDSSVVGKKLKDFTSIDENGNVVKASRVIDHKPAVIIFFAIGDKPGTFDFMPAMNSLYEKYRDRVVFMAVLLSRSNPKEVKELKQMLPLKIPVYLGYRDAIKGYNIRKIDVPLILIVDDNQTIRHIIARPESTMEEVYPPDSSITQKDTQEGRIKQSIELIDRYIKQLLKEQ
ncbi:peroxiredoxin family protein [Persephonella sp.]